MRTRLQHVYPQPESWDDDPSDIREVWRGQMRIINRQRARKLRRRGVPMWRSIDVTRRGQHRHAWFVEDAQA